LLTPLVYRMRPLKTREESIQDFKMRDITTGQKSAKGPCTLSERKKSDSLPKFFYCVVTLRVNDKKAYAPLCGEIPDELLLHIYYPRGARRRDKNPSQDPALQIRIHMRTSPERKGINDQIKNTPVKPLEIQKNELEEIDQDLNPQEIRILDLFALGY